MTEEEVDIRNEKGEVIGQKLKTEAHKDGLFHLVVIGCLKNSDAWSLVVQASDRQDAGQLVAPVGGHVRAGETEVEALLRESEEEIGTRNVRYRYVGKKSFRRSILGRDENHLFAVYEIETDDTITLNEESVSIDSYTSDDSKQALSDYPEKFGEAYYFVLEAFYPEYLPTNYKYRWS